MQNADIAGPELPFGMDLRGRISAMRWEADGIITVEITPADSQVSFPPFEAGAHIDLHLANGIIRSYSLCNVDDISNRYVIGVLLDKNSRGGSRYVHETLRVGDILQISAPRNNFRLVESAPRSVLVAGGIGITPIWSMLQRLTNTSRPVVLIYSSRSRRGAAFLAAIETLAKAHKIPVTLHFDDEVGHLPDLTSLLANYTSEDHYYCCGPSEMLEAFERACSSLGFYHAHVERFAPISQPLNATDDGSFVVECAKSGRQIQVPPDRSILDCLISAGLAADFSCREGVCGACETKCLEGDIDHRDSILTKKDRASNRVMMICVSRCKGDRLVLDI